MLKKASAVLMSAGLAAAVSVGSGLLSKDIPGDSTICKVVSDLSQDNAKISDIDTKIDTNKKLLDSLATSSSSNPQYTMLGC